MNKMEWLGKIATLAMSKNPKKELLKMVVSKAVSDSTSTKEVLEAVDAVVGTSIMNEYVAVMTNEELYDWIVEDGDEWLMEVLTDA